MSKKRAVKKNYKVFCEGSTEYNYINSLKKEFKISIALKTVNMKGGGYAKFKQELAKDGDLNCLAKFIIIDGDIACDQHNKSQLEDLISYCQLKNKNGCTPHILILNCPDFEYIACLHFSNYTTGDSNKFIIDELKYKDISDFKSDVKIYHKLNKGDNSYEVMLCRVKKNSKHVINNMIKIFKNTYEIKVTMDYDLNILDSKTSNIHDFFETITKL